MPSITWLHLSDLHACSVRDGWDAARVEEKLVEDLARLRDEQGLAPDLLFFTGDAAFGRIGSKRPETVPGQLDEFGELLDTVRTTLHDAFPWENVFLVPGNHDVDRSLVDSAQTEWLDRDERRLDEVRELVQRSEIQWRRYMDRLGDYRRFLEQHGELDHLLEDPDRLIWTARRTVSGVRVGIAGFNSAWSCCRKGERGKLWMAGAFQQGMLRKGLEEADFSIALMHHSPEWLVEQESPAFGQRLQQDFRFLLHGHDHRDWVRAEEGFATLAAGACYERSEGRNGYSVVRLDPETGRGEVWLRRYDPDGGGWVPRHVHGKTDERGVWPLELPWLRELGGRAAPASASPPSGSAAEPPTAPGASPGFETSPELQSYLWRLRSTHGSLPVAGFETRVRVRIKVDEVYVPLRAVVQHRALASEQKAFGTLRQLEEEIAEEREVPFDDALALAREHDLSGVVVVGDPGSGKTTLLKHFALAASDPETGASSLGLPPGTVPVLVTLRKLGRPTAGLEPAIAAAVAEVDPAVDAPRFARELLARDRLLVLLDGLDEVADEAERAAVSRWLEAALGRQPGSTFAVTSRYAGYKGDARLDGRFLELHVRDLVETEARRFIGSWYRAVEAHEDLGRDPEAAAHVADEESGDLARRIFEEEGERTESLRRLARNPLMLQILCLVHRDRKSLPEKRVELYRECVVVLLELWRRAKKIQLDFTAREALTLLQPLAWWLHASERKEATIEEILPHLAAPLKELGADPGEGERLLRAIRDQSGLLVSLGRGAYGFLHLSLQEYLAARHVQGRLHEEPELVGQLASHFGEGWWREVLLLAMGLDNPSLFGPVTAELLRQEVLHRDDTLAGYCLRDALVTTPRPVLDALAAGVASWQERYAALRLLRGIAGWEEEAVAAEWGAGSGRELVETVAREDGNEQVRRLASELVGLGTVREVAAEGAEEPRAGQERVHPVDGSVLVYVPGGEFVLGAEDISDDEKPVHRVHLSPYWIGKYPVTNEQYARYLEANPGEREPEYWGGKGFDDPRQPVVGVSWHEAMAYCRWAGLALPTEAQWEAAARGPDGRRYPWGNEEPTAERANFGNTSGGPTPVGAFPAGAGPYGTVDQVGNVWEWCADRWEARAYEEREGAVDPSIPVVERAAVEVALRGGSWAYPAQNLAVAFRNGYDAGFRGRYIGFRVVLSPVSEHGD